jgi:hypothetical protein
MSGVKGERIVTNLVGRTVTSPSADDATARNPS